MPSTVDNGTFTFSSFTGASVQANQFRDTGDVLIGNGGNTILTDSNRALECTRLRFGHGTLNCTMTGCTVRTNSTEALIAFGNFDAALTQPANSNWRVTFDKCLINTNSARIVFGNAQANGINSAVTFRDCLVRTDGVALFGRGTVIENSTFYNLTQGFGVRATFDTPITGLVIQDSTFAFTINSSFNIVVKNATLKNITGANDFQVADNGASVFTGLARFVNLMSRWTFLWGGFGTGGASPITGTVRREHTYSLTVLNTANAPVQGVSVRIADKDNVQSFLGLTSANGSIPTLELVYGDYNQPRGNVPLLRAPYTVRQRQFGKQFVDLSLNNSEAKNDISRSVINPFITLTEIQAAAVTGMSVDTETQTIAITGTVTIAQFRAFLHKYLLDNMTVSEFIVNQDATTDLLSYNLTINGGTLTAPGHFLNLGSKAFTLTGGGTTSALVQDVSGVQAVLVIVNVVAGSTVRIFSPAGTLINELVASSSTFSYPYTWTADVVRDIGIFRTGRDPFYFRGVTLGNRGVSQRAEQVRIREVIYA